MLRTLIILTVTSLVLAKHHHHEFCHTVLGNLSTTQAQFLQCTTKHSVPVTMCVNCKIFHENVLINYDILVDNCSEIFFDKDRINLVASTESVLNSLWTKAYCDDCFNNSNASEFNDKYEDLDVCLNNTKTEDRCKTCNEKYNELNNFYIKLDQHNNGEVCFDLQDKMNRTRNYWSNELKCCLREYNMTLFTIALSIILSLPVVFYCSTYYITKRQERNHDVLNDEGLPNNLSQPPTSHPTQMMINDNLSSSSRSATNNNSSAPTLSKKNKPNKNISDSDDISEDDEIIETKTKLQ